MAEHRQCGIPPPAPLELSSLQSAHVPDWTAAVLFGGTSDLKQPLDSDLDPNSAIPNGTTALMMAAPDFEKTALLIARGATRRDWVFLVAHSRTLDKGIRLAGPGLARLTSDPLLDRMINRLLRTSHVGYSPQLAAYRQFGVPWLTADIHLKLKTLSDDEVTRLFATEVPGGAHRPNGSPYYIAKIPDLIGILDRKYIDHTATHQHRGSGDLMRYAALVEYSDSMDFGSHRMLSDAQRRIHVRWPDELLYALAQYIYSLQPPVISRQILSTGNVVHCRRYLWR